MWASCLINFVRGCLGGRGILWSYPLENCVSSLSIKEGHRSRDSLIVFDIFKGTVSFFGGISPTCFGSHLLSGWEILRQAIASSLGSALYLEMSMTRWIPVFCCGGCIGTESPLEVFFLKLLWETLVKDLRGFPVWPLGFGQEPLWTVCNNQSINLFDY